MKVKKGAGICVDIEGIQLNKNTVLLLRQYNGYIIWTLLKKL
jgi:hypothetical protein